MLLQHMGLPALADRLPPPPRLPTSQPLTQPRSQQAGQAASHPVLPQAADLGSQLARLSSLQALAGIGGSGFPISAAAMTGGAEAPWPAQQQQQQQQQTTQQQATQQPQQPQQPSQQQLQQQ
jgi:hypothetical protein